MCENTSTLLQVVVNLSVFLMCKNTKKLLQVFVKLSVSGCTYLVKTGSCAPMILMRVKSRKRVEKTRNPARTMEVFSHNGILGLPCTKLFNTPNSSLNVA